MKKNGRRRLVGSPCGIAFSEDRRDACPETRRGSAVDRSFPSHIYIYIRVYKAYMQMYVFILGRDDSVDRGDGSLLLLLLLLVTVVVRLDQLVGMVVGMVMVSMVVIGMVAVPRGITL